jgi:heat shock protein HtpX
MATLYTQTDRNVRQTWVLLVCFLAGVIALGWLFAQIWGEPLVLYGAVIFALLMNLGSYWWSDKIVLKLAGARPASRETHFGLFTTVENLAITAGLPAPKIYIIDDPAPNAFATGRNKDHAAVAVTTGLLAMLENEELEGVIAHELAHIGNRDILLSTVVVVLVGFVAILSDWFLRSLWWGGGHRSNSRGHGLILIFGIALAILSPLVATLIRLAVSRRREFLADATGALLTRYPEGLARALEKIAGYRAPMRRAGHATAHLFIANPFGAGAGKGLHKLFLTHPPVEERLAALRGRDI